MQPDPATAGARDSGADPGLPAETDVDLDRDDPLATPEAGASADGGVRYLPAGPFSAPRTTVNTADVVPAAEHVATVSHPAAPAPAVHADGHQLLLLN